MSWVNIVAFALAGKGKPAGWWMRPIGMEFSKIFFLKS
jgi:hypothetical protein